MSMSLPPAAASHVLDRRACDQTRTGVTTFTRSAVSDAPIYSFQAVNRRRQSAKQIFMQCQDDACRSKRWAGAAAAPGAAAGYSLSVTSRRGVAVQAGGIAAMRECVPPIRPARP